MSEHDTAFAAGLEEVLAVLGGPVTHADADGAETAVDSCSISETRGEVIDGDGGQTYRRTATACLPVSAVAHLRRGDTLTADGVDWTVESARTIAGGEYWHADLVRTAPVERSRRGYRMDN